MGRHLLTFRVVVVVLYVVDSYLAACSLLVVNSYSKVHFRPLFCQLLRQDAIVFLRFQALM